MAPTTTNDGENFLMTCILNVKPGSGKVTPDWDVVGAKLGVKPHTAYCRWNTIMKAVKITGGGDSSQSTPAGKGKAGGKGKESAARAASAGRKRKTAEQQEESDVSTPAPKRGKGSKVKKEDIVSEDEDGGKGREESCEDSVDEAFMGI